MKNKTILKKLAKCYYKEFGNRNVINSWEDLFTNMKKSLQNSINECNIDVEKKKIQTIKECNDLNSADSIPSFWSFASIIISVDVLIISTLVPLFIEVYKTMDEKQGLDLLGFMSIVFAFVCMNILLVFVMYELISYFKSKSNCYIQYCIIKLTIIEQLEKSGQTRHNKVLCVKKHSDKNTMK